MYLSGIGFSFCLIPLVVVIVTMVNCTERHHINCSAVVIFYWKESMENHQAQAIHDVNLQTQISYNLSYDPLCFSSFITFQMTLSKQLRLPGP